MTSKLHSTQLPVLIVDDDAGGSDALSGYLRYRRYRATVIRSGSEALRYLMGMAPDERPCLILLDVLMPELNGCQVLQQLKSRPETRAIPVIMLSVLSRDEIQDQLSDPCEGATSFLSKPFDLEKLVAEVDVYAHR